MFLNYPSEWMYGQTPGEPTVPEAFIDEFVSIVSRAVQRAANPKIHWERAKQRLHILSGTEFHPSTSTRYAEVDLHAVLQALSDKPALAVDGCWRIVSDLNEHGLPTPPLPYFNELLRRHQIHYKIDPPRLLPALPVPPGTIGSAATATESNPPEVPRLYRVLSELGFGASGVVHKAELIGDYPGFFVALKLLDPSPHNRTDPLALEERFRREVAAVQKLQHKAIVNYRDAGKTPEGRHYFVMDFIKGKTLRDHAENCDFQERIRLVEEVLEGVQYSHDRGVFHRDLKPANILVRESDSQPIIVDFGVSHLSDEEFLTLTRSAVGSAAYIPPEVLANPALGRTPLHDIWSCGVILYEILAGFRPNPQAVRPLATIAPALGSLDEVIGKALAPKGKRFATANEFLTDLRRATKRRSSTASARVTVPPSPHSPLHLQLLRAVANATALREDATIRTLVDSISPALQPYQVSTALGDLVNHGLVELHPETHFDFGREFIIDNYIATQAGFQLLGNVSETP